jgi:hypothetical protein
MPGQKDIIDNFIIGEGYKSVEDVKKAFKKEWAAVKSGRIDIGSSKVEKFYSALFDFYADSGDMPLGTQKARTGDPHEWIHDRLGLDEGGMGKKYDNVSAKGIREYEDIEKEIEGMGEIEEAKTMGGILRKVKKGTPPYTVVAMVRGKVVDQQTARVASQVPAIIAEFQGGGSGATDLGSKHVGDVKIAVEDKDSRVVYSEGFTRRGLKVGDLLQHMKETYAPGNITRMPSPDFDERQGMFNSNYKRINGRSPSKAELRAAGVGKGGDNPKGVKAWKAAMAKLKASNNEEKKLSYKERIKILKDLDMQIGGKGKKGKK